MACSQGDCADGDAEKSGEFGRVEIRVSLRVNGFHAPYSAIVLVTAVSLRPNFRSAELATVIAASCRLSRQRYLTAIRQCRLPALSSATLDAPKRHTELQRESDMPPGYARRQPVRTCC